MDRKLVELCENIVDASRKAPYDFIRNVPEAWNIYLTALVEFKRLVSIENALWLITTFDMANLGQKERKIPWEDLVRKSSPCYFQKLSPPVP